MFTTWRILCSVAARMMQSLCSRFIGASRSCANNRRDVRAPLLWAVTVQNEFVGETFFGAPPALWSFHEKRKPDAPGDRLYYT